ncbi:hypothetical protein CVT26_000335 [Gymnopilus dilepis]|uniref:ATP-dependent DNA helicase n=1 Tax=Gymnopilus dilepis TaxID=231916 RepID=A0A409VHH7_9AGAR|nr:hypothetical protein CVT26_000335 [Gymnopilus dilepis]
MRKYIQGDLIIPYAHCFVSSTAASESFEFIRYTDDLSGLEPNKDPFDVIVARVPLQDLLNYVNVQELRSLAKLHDVQYRGKTRRDELIDLFKEHSECETCRTHFAIFTKIDADPLPSNSVEDAEPQSVSTPRERRQKTVPFTLEHAFRYATDCTVFDGSPPDAFTFLSYTTSDVLMPCDDLLVTKIPLTELITFLSKEELHAISACHGIVTNKKTRATEMKTLLKNHACHSCPEYVTSWKMARSVTSVSPEFPPKPVDVKTIHRIALGWANEFLPENITESGCTVCGLLFRDKDLLTFDKDAYDLDVLKSPLSRQERRFITDPIKPMDGPLLDPRWRKICPSCDKALAAKKMPLYALANGFWIGDVPDELEDLTFAEKLLVARVRHNRCVVRVASGRVKMMANVIMFSNPTPLIYDVLPPPKDDLDDVLAFIYTGSSMPTEYDKSRTPLLVRRNKVGRALSWLKLNHVDYHDIEISSENLKDYPEYGVPFLMEYHRKSGDTNKDPLTMSLHDDEDEEGTSEGPCPFIVHGLTGTEYSTMSTQAMKTMALRHLQAGDVSLAFPIRIWGYWPMPLEGKMDVHFPIVAFNHEQMKSSIDGSFLAAKRADFPDIAERLSQLNPNVLVDIAGRMLSGEIVKPSTDAERLCFKLLGDIDHVGGHVQGSLTTKKQRRNELWSLMASKGAPMWFITFSPADVKHPLCLYYAGKQVDFQPEVVLPPEERKRLISQNPVAAAKFFHFMVQAFIRHILGMKDDQEGLFGKTDAYYGMVEQQGRLTLHLHVLLWIAGSPSPQQIRDRLVAGQAEFQKALVDYLESVHTGDFLTGTKDEIKERVQTLDSDSDATLRLAPRPPEMCDRESCNDDGCEACLKIAAWYDEFCREVDELLLRSNLHTCRASSKDAGSSNGPKGCLSKDGQCAARFPREIFLQTLVDLADGHIDLKKLEPMMNTIAPLITYAMRSNTDCTCLLSGTAIKSVIIYVTDYVVKQTLKSHQLFSTAHDILRKNELEPEADENALNVARRTLLKIVNSLSTKLEIGSPMASMYLLGNPDHYTSHSFVPFYWKSYVRRARRDVHGFEGTADPPSLEDQGEDDLERVQIGQNDRIYYEKSQVHDYIYRPAKYDKVCLWNWIQCYGLRKRTAKECAILKYLLQGSNIDVQIEMEPKEIAAVPEKYTTLSEDGKRIALKEILDVSFSYEHPLFITHAPVYNAAAVEHLIPNILGGALPRSDTGDREFYCATMLTLFKPWRSGQDLINSLTSWETSFNDHQFTTRQRALMTNFNLRHECLDARDDYSAKRKAAQASNFLINRNILNDDPDTTDSEFEEDVLQQRAQTIDDRVRDAFSNHSSKYTENLRKRYEIDCMLSDLGLASDVPQTLTMDDDRNVGLNDFFSPDTYHTPSGWKNVVKAAREALLRNLAESTADQNTARLNGMEDDYRSLSTQQLRLLDESYFLRDYKARTKEAQDIIEHVSSAQKLNSEQERAFRLIANHASSLAPEQLKMYIGGMAGTGKSRVVHAVKNFFELRKESGRYVVIAPTGTAAAQLHGSTYHSLLGFAQDDDDGERRSDQTSLRSAQDRLKGVNYIIFDEISMVPCHDLYKISARFCEIKNNPDEIFGGLNIIVLGDFAQLSPVGGTSLYSGEAMRLPARPTTTDQEGFLGRAIWHQFTTVVMLVQNMRQLQQSEEDARFRTCLTNMRYGACTDDDIKFLDTLVVHNHRELRPEFRNAAVITRYNAQRDRLNEIGVTRFASDTGQKIHDFYSEDALAVQEEGQTKKRKRRRRVKLCSFSPQTQELLWSLPPAANNKHIPGKISLCKGLPILIRNNDATELCITKGQPAVVVGWDARTLPGGKEALNTLFVRLVDPPKDVCFEGLPKNIVPLPTKLNPRLYIQTPSGETITIKRWQVPALPYFGMTDYTSQGKTRAWNLVHILHSFNHQAIYTALSRASTAHGSAILYGYDKSKIQKGMSGYLRQEFRELEALNKMTEMRYLKRIPDNAITDLRSTTLMNYNRLKKIHPDLRLNLHEALRTSASEDILVRETLPVLNDANVNKNAIAERVKTSTKKVSREKPESRPNKKSRMTAPQTMAPNVCLRGPVWDAENYSCAYDSLLFILQNLYSTVEPAIRSEWSTVSPLVANLVSTFESQQSPDIPRDMLRQTLHFTDPVAFPMGKNGADIEELAVALLDKDRNDTSSQLTCNACGSNDLVPYFTLDLLVYPMCPSITVSCSLQEQWTARHTNACRCSNGCVSPVQHNKFASNRPVFVMVPMAYENIILDCTIPLQGEGLEYRLKGGVYHGSNHFTALFLDNTHTLWHHDGMHGSNAKIVTRDYSSGKFPPSFEGRRQALAIYERRIVPSS